MVCSTFTEKIGRAALHLPVLSDRKVAARSHLLLGQFKRFAQPAQTGRNRLNRVTHCLFVLNERSALRVPDEQITIRKAARTAPAHRTGRFHWMQAVNILKLLKTATSRSVSLPRACGGCNQSGGGAFRQTRAAAILPDRRFSAGCKKSGPDFVFSRRNPIFASNNRTNDDFQPYPSSPSPLYRGVGRLCICKRLL